MSGGTECGFRKFPATFSIVRYKFQSSICSFPLRLPLVFVVLLFHSLIFKFTPTEHILNWRSHLHSSDFSTPPLAHTSPAYTSSLEVPPRLGTVCSQSTFALPSSFSLPPISP